MSEQLTVQNPDVNPLDTGLHHINAETLQRFERAYRARINLLTIDLPREMGYDPQIVDVQRIIDIAEKKGVLDKLYQEVGATTAQELMEKMIALPKLGSVGKMLGGVAHRVGITYEEMSDQKMFVSSFLKTIDSAEGTKKLNEALTKLGY
jgi:hypothetical protein